MTELITPEYIDEKIKEIHRDTIESIKANKYYWAISTQEFNEGNEAYKILFTLNELGISLIKTLESINELSHVYRRVANLFHMCPTLLDYDEEGPDMPRRFMSAEEEKLSYLIREGLFLLHTLQDYMKLLHVLNDNDIEPVAYREQIKELIFDILEYSYSVS